MLQYSPTRAQAANDHHMRHIAAGAVIETDASTRCRQDRWRFILIFAPASNEVEIAGIKMGQSRVLKLDRIVRIGL